MSVEVRAYLNKKITPEMVLEVVKSNIDKKASLENENGLKNMSFYNLYLTLKDIERTIFIIYSNDKITNTCYDGNQEYLLLSMNSDKNSIKLMNNIVNIFGGYIDENDCDDKPAQFVECNGSYEEYIKLAEETKIDSFIQDIKNICEKYNIDIMKAETMKALILDLEKDKNKYNNYKRYDSFNYQLSILPVLIERNEEGKLNQVTNCDNKILYAVENENFYK